MKLLNIIGAVVAIHVAVLVLAVAIPGCRSTNSTPGSVDASADPATDVTFEPVPQTSPISAAPELSDNDLNPPVSGDPMDGFDPDAPAIASGSMTSSGRYSPTRPQAAGNAVNLPAAMPVQTAPSTTYTVVRGDNLWSLAKRNDLSVRELAAANNLRADAGLRIGQVLVIPGKTVQPAASSVTTAAAAAPSRTYLIQPGDTLAVIARRHNVTVAQLKAFNNLRSDLVRAGDRLAIPEAETPSAAAATTSTTAASTTPAATPARSGGSNTVHTHVVSPGESLTVIANRYKVSIGSIALANQIRDPSLIRPGQELKIPGATVPKPTTSGSNISAAAASRASAAPVNLSDDTDLDAGLDDADLQNVPVIQVEEEDDFDDEPIKTIGAGGDASDSPPLFN